jgi:PE family protein
MADNDMLRMRPTEVADASAQLDALASRVEQLMQTETPNLSVQPGGHDEVSQRVANTLNGVHDTFGTSVERGVTEMRETAATLRSHADDVTHLDEGFAV